MALRFSTGLKNKLLGKTVDLVNNGSFESATTGWSAYNATTSVTSGGYSGNCLQITNSTNGKGYVAQTFTVKTDHRYLLEIAHKNGSANGYIKIGTSPDDDTYENETCNDTDWKVYRFYVKPTTDTLCITLGVDSVTSGDTTLFDEVKCIWEASSIKEIFTNSKIVIYTGTQPASADDAPTGTPLVEITTSSSGDFDLQFEEADDGAITKQLNATWSGVASNTGSAGWFRLMTIGDSLADSTEDCRIDGAVATSGAELNMADTSIQANSVQTISVFRLSIPL